MSDAFFGGTDFKKFSTLTGNQENLLNQLSNQYSSLGEMAGRMQSTYQGAPQDYFNQAIGNPLRSQYQNTLANLRHTGKRHSSATQNMINKAGQNYLQQLGQQSAEFANQERLREMQAAENLRQAQMNLYGLQNQVAGTSLGTRAFENVAVEDSGMLGKISSLINLGGSVAGGFMGM